MAPSASPESKLAPCCVSRFSGGYAALYDDVKQNEYYQTMGYVNQFVYVGNIYDNYRASSEK